MLARKTRRIGANNKKRRDCTPMGNLTAAAIRGCRADAVPKMQHTFVGRFSCVLLRCEQRASKQAAIRALSWVAASCRGASFLCSVSLSSRIRLPAADLSKPPNAVPFATMECASASTHPEFRVVVSVASRMGGWEVCNNRDNSRIRKKKLLCMRWAA